MLSDHVSQNAPEGYFKFILNLHNIYSDSFTYSSKVDLFFKCCNEIAVKNMGFNLGVIYAYDQTMQHKYVMSLFTSLVNSIRTGLNSTIYKRKLYDLDNKASRNYQSTVNYVKCLFASNSRLFVLSIDFSYLQNHSKNICIKKAKSDFYDFLNNVRGNKKLSSELEGYLWKVEYGSLKGIHFHCLFFYKDTAPHCDAEYRATQLGSCWKNTTENYGVYSNKNASTTDFNGHGHHGLGVIRRQDDNKIYVLLNIIIRYLVSVDQYLVAKDIAGNKHKLFGKGQCHCSPNFQRANDTVYIW